MLLGSYLAVLCCAAWLLMPLRTDMPGMGRWLLRGPGVRERHAGLHGLSQQHPRRRWGGSEVLAATCTCWSQYDTSEMARAHDVRSPDSDMALQRCR